MAGVTKKRKARSIMVEPEKRQRIEKPPPSLEPQLQSEDEDEDEDYRNDAGDFSENEQNADTPSTPFSPFRRKFPSELKTLKCTWEGCTKAYNRPIRLQNHLRTHKGERSFVCTYEGCDKAYFEDKHLQQHIKGSHTHERKFQCDWEGCTKCFLTSTRLKRHTEAHQGHERFRCTGYPPCNETFRKHQTLQRHIRSDHLELAPYPCTHRDPITLEPCNAGFDGAGGLRKHEERVHGILQFFCLECTVPNSFRANGSPASLGFITNALLQTHIRKEHANSTCMFCDRRCSSQRELQKHIDSQHSGITLQERKNTHCTYIGCDKSFTKKSNLTTHIRTAHMGERYICGDFDTSSTTGLEEFMPDDGCNKEFSSKACLEDHVRTAHLNLSSVVNANRKKASSLSDVEEEDEFNPKPRKKKRGGKSRKSTIEQLLGVPYTAEDQKRDLQLQLRSARQLPKVGSHDPSFMRFDPDLEWPDIGLQMGDGMQGVDELQEQMPAPGEGVDALEDQADIDWELQRRALEGGPFWIGANEDEDAVQNQDSWMQEEMEMRKLIGEDSRDSMYPSLDGM